MRQECERIESVCSKGMEICPAPTDMGHRSWGKETLLCVAPGKYTLKALNIEKGNKGGLQFHRLKDESGYLVSGRLLVRYDKGDGSLEEKILVPGDHFRFPPGLVHQEEALEDCLIIEASTAHANDRVRVEEQYGLVADQSAGLPTTTMDEILIL